MHVRASTGGRHQRSHVERHRSRRLVLRDRSILRRRHCQTSPGHSCARKQSEAKSKRRSEVRAGYASSESRVHTGQSAESLKLILLADAMRLPKFSIVFLASTSLWAADPPEIPLWPNGAAGSQGLTLKETV